MSDKKTALENAADILQSRMAEIDASIETHRDAIAILIAERGEIFRALRIPRAYSMEAGSLAYYATIYVDSVSPLTARTSEIFESLVRGGVLDEGKYGSLTATLNQLAGKGAIVHAGHGRWKSVQESPTTGEGNDSLL